MVDPHLHIQALFLLHVILDSLLSAWEDEMENRRVYGHHLGAPSLVHPSARESKTMGSMKGGDFFMVIALYLAAFMILS